MESFLLIESLRPKHLTNYQPARKNDEEEEEGEDVRVCRNCLTLQMKYIHTQHYSSSVSSIEN